jgi:hypothetical protein
MATIENWLRFRRRWRYVLDHAALVPGFKEFHAKNGGHTQRMLNLLLAYVMRECNIQGYCVTMDTLEYLSLATPRQRSQIGNEYSFAAFACFSVVAERFRQAVPGAAMAFYVEKGGPGFDRTMQLMGDCFKDERTGDGIALATYGPADRTRDLPCHPADLIAHEVVTNRYHSQPLNVLDEWLTVTDVTHEILRDALADFDAITKRFRWLKSQRKKSTKRK